MLSRTDAGARGRRGPRPSGVTAISGVPLDDRALEELAGELKRRCGTGGTAKEGIIVIQGDHVEPLIAELRKRGYTVKKSGG
jgi:translation initiation factor 1